jgi:membrane associated rhomboid family serine protease
MTPARQIAVRAGAMLFGLFGVIGFIATLDPKVALLSAVGGFLGGAALFGLSARRRP